MEEASLATTGGNIAVAIAAGKIVSTNDTSATAVKDRFDALKGAIADRSDKIRIAPVEEDPASVDARADLAKDLEEYGAGTDRRILTTAKELLALIGLEESTREAAGDTFADVEKALAGLSELDVEGMAAPTPRGSSRSSRARMPDEPSKTELERMALPMWQRTERFFLKLGVLVAGVIVGAIALYFYVRTPPNELLEGCQSGDKAKCWQMVVAEDTASQGRTITPEPLERLCEDSQDACACAGLAYVNASSSEDSADCSNLDKATKIDARWPCTCTRYGYWKAGEMRTAHCGIPKCN